MNHYKITAKCKIILAIVLMCCTKAMAVPPFISDDAEPTDNKHTQFYLYASNVNAPDTFFLQAPGLETDYGLIPNTEIYAIVYENFFIPDQGPRTSGMGDVEIGLESLILSETDYRPEIAIEPTLFIPTANPQRNLGNGRSWQKLSIWIEKHWGKWKVFGGGGYGINSAPNQRNYPFGGIVVEKDLNDNLSLGVELAAQGSMVHTTSVASNEDNGHVTYINFGGNYNLNSNWQLLASVGHSIAGSNQWIGYLGLSLYI